jgi:integrase
VRVFDETVGGRRLVRVQWNESKGAPLSTESGRTRRRTSRRRRATRRASISVSPPAAAPVADRTVRELAELHIAAFVESWAEKTLCGIPAPLVALRSVRRAQHAARLITEETLDEFRARMRVLKVVTNQRTETVKAVKQVFRWARHRKLIAENPIADYTIKRAKSEKIIEVPEWSPVDTTRLGAQLLAERASRSSRHWRLEVAFFLASAQGPRINALLHLAWDDVNLSGETVRHPSAAGVVLPPRSVWWNPAFDKMDEERVQPLTRGAVRALRIARVWRARIGYAGRWVFAPARAARLETGESWGYQAANYALRELCDRCTPAVPG